MTFNIGEVEVINEVSLAPSAALYDGATTADGDLTIKVNHFYYDIAGTRGKYVGSCGNAVTDGYTNYVYLDDAATLVINTIGYPVGTYIPLSRVITSGGFIVRIILERAFLSATASSADFVPGSRLVTAGDGLIGGGNLSVDRVFDIVAHADGSIVVNLDDIQVGILATDNQHGNRGGGTLHAVAVAGVSNGFMSSIDKTTLDALAVGYYAASATDPISPVPIDGYQYFNTVLHEEMQYDGYRSKWLTIAQITLLSGAFGVTVAGSFFKGADGSSYGTNIGHPVPKGTIIGLLVSKTSAAASEVEILIDTTVIATVAVTSAGLNSNLFLNADFASGLMKFRNKSTGSIMQNVQITALLKRRV